MASTKLTDASVPAVAAPSRDMQLYVTQSGATKRAAASQVLAVMNTDDVRTALSVTFTGNGGKALAVKSDGSGVELVTLPTGSSVFTSVAAGIVPASGGGTANFLRADGSWASPPAGGSGISDGNKGDVTVASSGATWTVNANAVTLDKLATVSTATFLGRVSSATGNVESLTGTQATSLLNVFTTSLKGLVPASGGGTTNFLRADGSWAAPPSDTDPNLRTDLATATGATLVGFQQAGSGAVTRSLRDKARDAVHAKDFGLVGDGSNETTKLTAFFNSAIANPGVPHYLDAKTYGINAALPSINVSNVWIEGSGAELHDTGTLMTGTVIKWVGTTSAGTSMVTIAPTSGASNQRLSGVFFRYIGLDCVALVGTGLTIRSLQESEIDVCTANATSTAVYVGVAASLGEAKDVQRNDFRVNGRQIEAPNGYTLTLDGDSTANTSLNTFEVDAQLSNVPAVRCINSDNNTWTLVRAFKASGTAVAGVVLQGGSSALVSARSENFIVYSGNIPIEAKGTAEYTVASKQNVIQRLDVDNSTPEPILGTGAVVSVANKFLTYTPTVSAFSGTVTSSTANGEYIVGDGGLVNFTANVTITNNGTGATILRLSLPIPCAPGRAYAASGKEIAVTGKSVVGSILPNVSTIDLSFFDGTYPGANGHNITVSGSYRAAV